MTIRSPPDGTIGTVLSVVHAVEAKVALGSAERRKTRIADSHVGVVVRRPDAYTQLEIAHRLHAEVELAPHARFIVLSDDRVAAREVVAIPFGAGEHRRKEAGRGDRTA